MATRISLAELNAIALIAGPNVPDDARMMIGDLIGEVSKWRSKARKLGEKLRTAKLDLRTCPGCGLFCGPDPKGTIYTYQNLHRWHQECWTGFWRKRAWDMTALRRWQTVSGWVSSGGVVHAVAFKDKTKSMHWFVTTECDRSFVSGRIFKNARPGMVCMTCARAVGLLGKTRREART